MQKQPLFVLCICYILGIFFQDFFSLEVSKICILTVVSVLLLSIYFFKGFVLFRLRSLSVFLFFISIGVSFHFLHSKKPPLPALNSKEQIVFKITRKLNSNEKNRRYEIEAWKGNETFKSVLSLPKSRKEFDFLHYYKAEVYVNEIEKPAHPYQFDYRKYLARKDIYFHSYLPESFQSGRRDDVTFAEKIRQKRLETLSKLDASSLQKPTREFTKGIILADRTEMDKGVVSDFSKSGLVHILAISGSHMMIIFWLILIVLNPVFPPKFRYLKIIISLLLIWAFAIFIDYGSSVVRSCVMISAYYIFVLLQRKSDLLHSMAIAAFLILIFDTNQIFDVGFQLSFLAVAGIFWFNQPILKYLPKPKNNLHKFFVNVVSVSISAQLATLPLVIYYFHQYSLISIIANLAIIPFSEFLIIFALFITILTAFSVEISMLNWVYEWCVTYILKVIHFFAEVEFAFAKMIPMSLPEVFVAFTALYFLRFAIVKFNFKNILRVTYFVLLFVVLRFSLNFRAKQVDEVVVHPFFKEVVISVKNKDEVQFMMHENINREKVQQYIIEPYLTSRRTKKFKVNAVPGSVESIEINNLKYDLK